jgi:hypothetical protein
MLCMQNIGAYFVIDLFVLVLRGIQEIFLLTSGLMLGTTLLFGGSLYKWQDEAYYSSKHWKMRQREGQVNPSTLDEQRSPLLGPSDRDFNRDSARLSNAKAETDMENHQGHTKAPKKNKNTTFVFMFL